MAEEVEYDHDIQLLDDSRILGLPIAEAAGQPLNFQQMGFAKPLTAVEAEAINIAGTAEQGTLYYVDVPADKIYYGNAAGQLIDPLTGDPFSIPVSIDFRTVDYSTLNIDASGGAPNIQTATRWRNADFDLQRNATNGMRIDKLAGDGWSNWLRILGTNGGTEFVTNRDQNRTYRIALQTLSPSNTFMFGLLNGQVAALTGDAFSNENVVYAGFIDNESNLRLSYITNGNTQNHADFNYGDTNFLKLTFTNAAKNGSTINYSRITSGVNNLESMLASANERTPMVEFASAYDDLEIPNQQLIAPGMFAFDINNDDIELIVMEIR